MDSKMHVRKVSLYLLSTMVILFIVGCSHQELHSTAEVKQEAIAKAKETENNPESLLQEANRLLEQAVEEDLSFYSPLHMQKAQESLKSARFYLNTPAEHTTNSASISAIAAKGFLTRAKQNKKNAQSSLADTFANHNLLLEIESPITFPQRYEEIKIEIGALLKQFERGEAQEAIENQEELITAMIQLEIDTLKESYLSDAYSIFQQATELGAEEYAAESFAATERLLEESARYISKNNRNKKGVLKQAEIAKISAMNTLNASIDSKRIFDISSEQSEQLVLLIYAKLSALEKINGVNTPHNQLLTESLDQAIATAKKKNKLISQLDYSLSKSLKTIEALQTNLSDLEAKQQAQASSIFSLDEEMEEDVVLLDKDSNEESFDTIEMVDEP